MPDPEIQDSTGFLYDVIVNGLQENPIERAKRLGTYGKLDRSKQYEGRYSPEMLLRSQDHAWKRIREGEQLRFRRAIVLMVVSAVLARGPEIVGWLLRLTR